MSGPLEGVTVLEVNRVAPGSLCTVMLADMGADVIRVTEPRAPQPPDPEKDPIRERRRVGNWIDRNKKSLTLNLKDPDAQQAMRDLAATADVFVEGFRPGVMARLGGDYETLSKLNPGLVYCSLSGFGQDGPYRDYPAHDLNYLAMAGVLGLIGEKDGMPAIPLNLIADYAGASMHGALGIMFALFARQNTGKGQLVDISYTDATVSLLSAIPPMTSWFGGGMEPARGVGTFDGNRPWYTVYKTGDDKLLSIACSEPWLWHNFCDAVDKPHLKDTAFTPGEDDRGPTEAQVAAKLEVAELMMTKTRDEWFDMLVVADVCVGKVHTPSETFADPQLLSRDMVKTFETAGGPVNQPGVAIRLSETPGSVRYPTPARGEHTDEVLAGIGYSDEKIAQLRAQGAV